jgi:dipeptidyl aminopeptidase/acylaminoacyl peptidase
MDIFGHYGETHYKNLMDFTDAVLQAWPQIDPARV